MFSNFIPFFFQTLKCRTNDTINQLCTIKLVKFVYQYYCSQKLGHNHSTCMSEHYFHFAIYVNIISVSLLKLFGQKKMVEQWNCERRLCFYWSICCLKNSNKQMPNDSLIGNVILVSIMQFRHIRKTSICSNKRRASLVL